jgi:hypothetical protein
MGVWGSLFPSEPAVDLQDPFVVDPTVVDPF